MTTIVIDKNRNQYNAVVEDLLRYLGTARERYPLFKGFPLNQQVEFIKGILDAVPEVQIILSTSSSGYLQSFAVLCVDTDIHIGKTVSVMVNYSTVNDLLFQRNILRRLKAMGRYHGAEYVAYSHMTKDGKGYTVRYIPA